MTLNTDFHSHVSRSSASHMVQSAKERGLHVLGLSEHIFQMSEARPILEHMPLEGPLLTFTDYIETVQDVARRLAFDVRLGLEVDFIPEQNEQIQASLQQYSWDFLIGSVHQIDGVQFERRGNLSQEEGEVAWLRYFELLRETVKSGYFSLVSHPIRMSYTNPHVPSTLDDELERLAAEATQHNVALELNGFDILVYPALVHRLAKACKLHRTPISVGSDAHKPGQVAQAHQQTEVLLREVGITKVRVWRQREAEEYSID